MALTDISTQAPPFRCFVLFTIALIAVIIIIHPPKHHI